MKVDEYVSQLIKKYGKEFGIDINPKNPKKESRLELALKLDELGEFRKQWEAMEIMVGIKIEAEDPGNVPGYLNTFIDYKFGSMDKMKFYGGFAEADPKFYTKKPKDKKIDPVVKQIIAVSLLQIQRDISLDNFKFAHDLELLGFRRYLEGVVFKLLSKLG